MTTTSTKNLTSVNTVADYIVYSLCDNEESLSQLKLHKLLYYVQAWRLAINGVRAFDEDFQAWVHGPVSKATYDRFKAEKGMFCPVTLDDISCDFANQLSESIRYHIDAVLERYGQFSGTQLEELTHQELPWEEARNGISPFERSEAIISDKTMADYYKLKLQSA